MFRGSMYQYGQNWHGTNCQASQSTHHLHIMIRNNIMTLFTKLWRKWLATITGIFITFNISSVLCEFRNLTWTTLIILKCWTNKISKPTMERRTSPAHLCWCPEQPPWSSSRPEPSLALLMVTNTSSPLYSFAISRAISVFPACKVLTGGGKSLPNRLMHSWYRIAMKINKTQSIWSQSEMENSEKLMFI